MKSLFVYLHIFSNCNVRLYKKGEELKMAAFLFVWLQNLCIKKALTHHKDFF